MSIIRWLNVNANVNVRELRRCLRIETCLKETRANRKETHVWYLAPPAAKAKHACPISRPHDLHLQYSVMVTNLHTNCSSFYLHQRDGSQSRACPLRRAVHESWLSSLESLLFPGAQSWVESRVNSLEFESSRVIAKDSRVMSRVIIAQLELKLKVY